MNYIAINRFQVNPERANEFEDVWKNRETFLSEVPGFQSFKLLRGAPEDGVQVFLSHSTWDSEAAFQAWTKSEAFKKAHSDARTPDGVLAGPPKFTGYEVILEQ